MSDKKRTPNNAMMSAFRLAVYTGIIGFAYYYMIWKLQLRAAAVGLYIITAVLFVLCFYLSYGFAKALPKKENLPDGWPETKKDAYIARVIRNKQISKKIIPIFLPFMFAVGFDIIYIVYIMK